MDQMVSQLRRNSNLPLPAVRVNVRDSPDPIIPNSLGTAYRMGEQLPNRVPYINTINIDPRVPQEYAPEVLRHELGHILEPRLLRGNMGQAFMDIIGLTPKADVSNWGLSREPAFPGGMSPVEFYAQVVAGQLGTPTYGELAKKGWTNERVNSRPYQPAINLAPAKMQMLVQMGLIPKKVK